MYVGTYAYELVNKLTTNEELNSDARFVSSLLVLIINFNEGYHQHQPLMRVYSTSILTM